MCRSGAIVRIWGIPALPGALGSAVGGGAPCVSTPSLLIDFGAALFCAGQAGMWLVCHLPLFIVMGSLHINVQLRRGAAGTRAAKQHRNGGGRPAAAAAAPLHARCPRAHACSCLPWSGRHARCLDIGACMRRAAAAGCLRAVPLADPRHRHGNTHSGCWHAAQAHDAPDALLQLRNSRNRRPSQGHARVGGQRRRRHGAAAEVPPRGRAARCCLQTCRGLSGRPDRLSGALLHGWAGLDRGQRAAAGQWGVGGQPRGTHQACRRSPPHTSLCLATPPPTA